MGRFDPDTPRLTEADVTTQVRDFLRAKGWRPLRMHSGLLPGARYPIRVGEPGMADYLFVRYLRPGVAAALWIEMKRPGARAVCRCAGRRSGKCTACSQAAWRAQESHLGAMVWQVDDFQDFSERYGRELGWLHDGRLAGQIEFPLTPEM